MRLNFKSTLNKTYIDRSNRTDLINVFAADQQTFSLIQVPITLRYNSLVWNFRSKVTFCKWAVAHRITKNPFFNIVKINHGKSYPKFLRLEKRKTAFAGFCTRKKKQIRKVSKYHLFPIKSYKNRARPINPQTSLLRYKRMHIFNKSTEHFNNIL